MQPASGCGTAAQVHKAWNLNIWSADGGFHGGSATADAYDTYVQLRLASDEDETRAIVREERTRIVDNARSPEYNSEFEFLGQRVSQRLQLAVVVTRALEHGRLHNQVMGRASVVLDDLARCPNGKVRREHLCRIWHAHLACTSGMHVWHTHLACMSGMRTCSTRLSHGPRGTRRLFIGGVASVLATAQLTVVRRFDSSRLISSWRALLVRACVRSVGLSSWHPR